MNAKETLDACIRLWDELAESGDGSKPQWAHEEYQDGCPCCQDVLDRQATCHTCLMRRSWGDQHCGHAGSSFYEWIRAETREERKDTARTIANDARAERAKLR